MSKLSHLSLTQKLLIAIALPLILVAIVLGVVINQQLQNTIPGLINNAGTRQVEARADEVTRWISGYRHWLSALAQDGRLSEQGALSTHRDWLAKRASVDPSIDSLFIADATGHTLNQTGDQASITDKPYFRSLVTDGNADRLLLEPFMSATSKRPVATLVETIFDDRGNRTGLIGVTFSLASLSNISSQINVGEGSYGWLIDSNGRVIAHPLHANVMSLNYAQGDQSRGYQGLTALTEEMLSGSPGSGEIHMPDGTAARLLWAPVDGISWVAGVTVPVANFTALSSSLLKSLLLIGGVLLVVLLIAIAYVAHRLFAPINQTANAMADIAKGKGDLTSRLTVASEDEIGALATAFNAFVERMQATLQEVRTNAQTVLGGANQIADGTQELSSRTEQSAANLQQTSASMEEIHSTVAHTSQASEQANKLAVDASSASQRGTESMQQMQAKMKAITESSNKISEIISLIDSIAFQTNILALNASVEAARAGEQGRGFAVVANEVRTLASRSASAAQEIRGLIDVSVKHTDEGNKIVSVTAQQILDVHHSITQVTDVISEIAAGAREQTTGITQINTAVAELDTITQENSSMVSHNAMLATQMRENAVHLNQLMAEFVLGGNEPGTQQRANARQRPAIASSPRVTTSPSTTARQARSNVEEWEAF